MSKRTENIPAADMRIGMVLVDGGGRRTPIRKLTIGASCLNFHVNDTRCYDRISRVEIESSAEAAA